MSHEDLRTCFADSASDPWKPTSRQDVVDLVPDSIGFPSRGLAVLDTSLFGYDHLLGSVFTWQPDGRSRRVFGRFGRGPGEFAPAGSTRLYPQPPVYWIDALADTIAVLDGNDVHLFAANGQFITRLRGLEMAIKGVRPFSTRVRRVPGGVILDVEARLQYDGAREPQSRRYALWLLLGDSATTIGSIELPALPWSEATGVYHGVEEAVPLWDRAKDCFVISDGGTERVFVGRLGRRGLDTVQISLPEPVPVRGSDESDLLKRLNVPGKAFPPSLPRRIRQLVVDPAGWIWLLPMQRDTAAKRVEIVRIALASSTVVRDTVQLFPLAFGGSGTYYARKAAPAGARILVKVTNVP